MGLLDTVMDYYKTIVGKQYVNEAANAYGAEGKLNVGNEPDAYRHLLWTAEMARKTNPTIAKGVSDYHEKISLPFGMFGTAHPLQTKEEKEMDLHNNALGIEIGQQSQSYEDTIRLVKELMKTNNVVINEPKTSPNTYTSYAKQKGLL